MFPLNVQVYQPSSTPLYSSCSKHVFTTPIDLPCLREEEYSGPELPLDLDCDGHLLVTEVNHLKLANIKNILISSKSDPAVKRTIVANAIRDGYKTILNDIFEDIRNSGRQIIFDGVDLSGLDLRYLNFQGMRAIGADFTGSDLSDANLAMAVLTRANLSKARAVDAFLLATVFENTLANGFTTDNSWFESAWTPVTKTTDKNVKTVNIHLNGRCNVAVGGRDVFVLPEPKPAKLSMACVIL
jgi:hypothetical protein